jgi:ubiquinone biosynthesis protein COQ4
MQSPSDDVRLHPWRALRCLVAAARDPENTEVGAAMVKALEGRSRERLRARFAAHPMGARILAEGRRLERELGDLPALGGLPAGSLGRCYADWMVAEGLSAEGLIQAAGYADPAASAERQLIDGRGASTHDVWHVVTGYGRDLLGELALLHFTLVQTRNTGLLLPCWLGVLARGWGREGRRLLFEARRRARRAAWLPAVDWESLLPEPLPAVREQLGLGPPPCYTPVWPEARRRRGAEEAATATPG